MTEKDSDLEELKDLQREATKRRTERKRQRTEAAGPETEQAPMVTEPAEAAIDSSSVATDQSQEVTIQDFADQIGSIVKEMEEAAGERPVLALLTAFSLGVLIGQLFSRR